jgi:hypothetical protein
VVEIAPDQQEEQQADRSVEPCFIVTEQRFIDAHAKRKQHCQRDRHVHVEAPLAQCRQGGGIKRSACKHHGRYGDQTGNELEKPGCFAFSAGPHRHRQEHDVGCRKTGHGKADEQLPSSAVPIIGYGRRVIQCGFKTDICQFADGVGFAKLRW